MATVRSLKNSIYFIEWSYNESSPTTCDAFFSEQNELPEKGRKYWFSCQLIV